MAKPKDYPFHSIQEEAKHHTHDKNLTEKKVPTYELAFLDQQFLLRHELRSVRLQLEYLKAEMKQIEQHIESTIVVFGSHLILSQEEAQIELTAAENYVKNYPNDADGERDLAKARNPVSYTHLTLPTNREV